MRSSEKDEKELIEKLKSMRGTEGRNPLRAQSGRARFLNEAAKIDWSVTPDAHSRRSMWKQKSFKLFPLANKEARPMINFITSAIVILTLILGGGGITVAAAQSSQPDSPLYDLKLLTENVQLTLTTDPDAQVQTALNFAARRLQEIQTLIDAGQIVPEDLVGRYALEVNQAIQFALNQPDNDATRLLTQMQRQLAIQTQVLDQIQSKGSQQNEAILLQTRTMMQSQLQLVQTGLADPIQLRDLLQTRDQDRLCDGAAGCVNNPENTGEGDSQPWQSEDASATSVPGSENGNSYGTGSDPATIGTPNDYYYGQSPAGTGPQFTPQPGQTMQGQNGQQGR